MKTKVHSFIIVAASVLTLHSNAFAEEDCAKGTSQLDSAPALQKPLNHWGGAQKLAGYWKLTGIAGTIQPTTIKIMVGPKQFSDQVAEKGGIDPVDANLQICVDVDDDQTLIVKAPHPVDPANAVIRISDFNADKGFKFANGQHSGLSFKPTSGFPKKSDD